MLVDGQPVLLLCSDNHLGLADHPRLRRAAADAAERWGVGAGGSRLVAGTMTIHRRLEERLAGVTGRHASLLFGSRLLANAGAIAALARPGDVIFADEGNHASIADGCRLSGAEVFLYGHGDVEHLRWGIGEAGGRGALIVSESVFSIDGEAAPLIELVELALRFGLRTVIDETHGLGACGPGGRGLLAELALDEQVDVIVGSLGTALGAHGGFVACDQTMARYLVNAASTFAHATALAPPVVAGALAALELLAERPRMVTRLALNAAVLRAGLGEAGWAVTGDRGAIMSLPIGEAQRAIGLAEAALAAGVFVEAIRPPAVPDAASRVRLAVMATHQASELGAAAATLREAARSVGVDPRSMARVSHDEAGLWTARAGLGADGEPVAVDPAATELTGATGVFDFEAPEPARRAA